jgi:AraC-like DNA-binding protein
MFSDKLHETTHNLNDVNLLVSLLSEFNISPEQALEGTGIDNGQLNDPCALVSHQQELKLFNNVRTLVPAKEIGILAAKRSDIASFGILGYAMLSCSSLQHAIELGMRYIDVAGPKLLHQFLHANGKSIYRVMDQYGVGDLLSFCVEVSLGPVFLLAQELLEISDVAEEIHFTYPEPSYIEHYRALFNTRLVFNSQFNQIVLRDSLLERPLPKANPLSAKLLEKLCAEATQQDKASLDHKEEVRNILLARPGHFPKIDQVAGIMDVAPRTLRRKLQMTGTSFQRILDEVRRQLSINYLTSTQFCVDEIANLVGFSDAANFRQAFKRWTGKTPSEVRLEYNSRPAAIESVSNENSIAV